MSWKEKGKERKNALGRNVFVILVFLFLSIEKKFTIKSFYLFLNVDQVEKKFKSPCSDFVSFLLSSRSVCVIFEFKESNFY
jgi:hypothetical protein